MQSRPDGDQHSSSAAHGSGPVTPLQMPLLHGHGAAVAASPAASPIRATHALGSSYSAGAPSTPNAAAAAGAAASVGDSSELMWEEQLRVAALAVAELQQLVVQRRKGAQQQPQQRNSDLGTLAYHALTPAQAESLTGHLLLTSHTLLHQLAEQWSHKHGGPPPAVASLQCHQPSPLPLPGPLPCSCKQDSIAAQLTPDASAAESTGAVEPADSSSRVSSAPSTPSTPSATAAAAAAAATLTASSAFSSSSSAPIRRTVLPFSNLQLLEKNILGLRTARGSQLRNGQMPGQHHRSSTSTSSSSSSSSDLTTILHAVDNGNELVQVHARDVQLLQGHFSQLLACPSSASLSLVHPYGLLLREFLTHWTHQAHFVEHANSDHAASAVVPSTPDAQHSGIAAAVAAAGFHQLQRITLDRAFLQRQVTALFSFISNHESLVVTSYPHLHQTSLCKKILRSCIRSAVLDDPLVFRSLRSWAREAYSADEATLRTKIESMRSVSLSEIGLTFPFNLVQDDLVDPAEREGEGVLGAGASSLMMHRTPLRGGGLQRRGSESVSEDDASDDEIQLSLPPVPGGGGEIDPDLASPIDTLIHSPGTSPVGLDSEVAQQMHAAKQRRGSASSTGIANRRTHSGGNAIIGRRASVNVSITLPSAVRGRSFTNGVHDVPTLDMPAAALTVPAAPAPQPYARSIALLSSFDAALTVESQLSVLVRTCRCIGEELQEFLVQHGVQDAVPSTPADLMPVPQTPRAPGSSGNASSSNDAFSLTCDDLFQIFAYCLLHARLESPVASVALLADCIDPAQLHGEPGYCLTTIQCAVQLILTWSEESARQHAAQAQAQAQAALQTPTRFVPATPPYASVASSYADGAHSTLLMMPLGSVQPPHSPSLSSRSTSSTSYLSSSSGGSLSVPPSPAHVSLGSAKPVQLLAMPSTAPTGDASAYAAMIAPRLDAFCIAADYLATDSSWQYLYHRDGIVVTKKLYPAESPIASVKGVGTLPYPLATVAAFLRNIHNRAHIDDIFVSARVLQHLSVDSKVVQYFFRARHWCQRRQSDMVLLHHMSTCSDGISVVVLAFSVTHPLAPPAAPYDRATVRASGWLLRPVEGGRATQCTYIVSPDANGFSPWIVNLVSTKQPLIIAAMGEYLATVQQQQQAQQPATPTRRGQAGSSAPSPAQSHSRSRNSSFAAGAAHP